MNCKLLWPCWVLLLPACGEDRPVREHTQVRTPDADEVASMKRFATPAERFGMRPPARSESEGGADLDWDLPEGWTGGPGKGGMRILDFRVTAEPEIQCYLTLTQAPGSTLEANINRWFNQFGEPPLDAIAIEAMPTARLFGVQGKLVELTGPFSDAMSNIDLADAGLLGIVAVPPRGAGCMTLKMVGPREAVMSRKDEFLALASSLGLAERHGGTGTSTTGAPESGAMQSSGAIPMFSNGGRQIDGTWPEDWREEQRSMRLLSFRIGDGTELAVSAFGGGVRDNINRWRGQMGLPPLTDAEIKELPTLPVVGATGYLAEMTGHMRDGMTNTDLPDATMLGLVCPLDGGENLFVKMWGPKDEVAARKGEFEDFVRSLRDANAINPGAPGGGK